MVNVTVYLAHSPGLNVHGMRMYSWPPLRSNSVKTAARERGELEGRKLL